MADFFKLLQEADIASLELERAKLNLDVTKEAFESAKEEYEDAKKALEKVLFKADDMAIPRQRIRKLIDDRAQALLASGLMVVEAPKASLPTKSAKSPKKASAKSSGKGKSEFGNEKEKDSVSADLN